MSAGISGVLATDVFSVGMTVADMNRSIDFYTTVLSCQKTADRQAEGAEYDRLYGLSAVRLRIVTLKLGEQTIVLTEFLTPKGRLIPPDWRSNDLTFQHIAIVVRDMAQAYQHLCLHGVIQTSPQPQTLPAWNAVAGGIQSFYFKDPDGHDLELIHFPAGKGDPTWQHATERLFIGIDHTAIVVASTTVSRAFYCGFLGLKLRQESENFGFEQAQLSGVPGARVRISSLQAAEGLGIELLEYIEPDDGRPMPTPTQANDRWFWQTTIAVEFLQLGQLQLIQDPDGHRICLVTVGA
jgi:catechol 2,3-dioxygenase-like lactoylglutathione lyase family enzyme